MEMMRNFGLLGALDIVQKRGLIAELKAEIQKDLEAKRANKAAEKQAKAFNRAARKADRIAVLEAKLEALRNPVGAKAIKANKKPGKVTVVKA